MEAGELGVFLEPLFPAGLQGLAVPLAGEHLPEVAAGDTQLRGGDGDAGEAGFEGLVRGTVDVAVCHGVVDGWLTGWWSGLMRKRNPWTLLRNRLNPLSLELHAAAFWRVSSHPTLGEWVKQQTWYELWWGDEACAPLCKERPTLGGGLFDPRVSFEEEHLEAEMMRELMTRQMMHRLLFAVDLSERMSVGWRRQFDLTGDFPEDARMVLIHGWRSNAVLAWAERWGEVYLGEAEV